MIAALSLSAWRARGRKRFCAALAAFALGFHALLMAAHQPAAVPLPYDLHGLCLTSGEAPASPAHDPGVPQHQRMQPCPICQSLQEAVPPPQAPLIVAFPWAVVRVVDPPAGAAPPPRLALTDLNPRGPPVLG